MNATDVTTSATFEMLCCASRGAYTVKVTKEGWLDLRCTPGRQLDPKAKLDFLRIVTEDENYFRLIHLTHNEVLKGEATFSGAFTGHLLSVVTDFFEEL